MSTEHPIYEKAEQVIEADKEQNRTVMAMLDRRGRCERCGCAIESIGLCDRCTEIVDKEGKE